MATGCQDFIFASGGLEDHACDLYDFPAREYYPTQGRWISPDPAGLGAVDLTNPQSLNRYAYVMNNPTTLIDPSGLSNINPLNCSNRPRAIACGGDALGWGVDGSDGGCIADGIAVNCGTNNALLQSHAAVSSWLLGWNNLQLISSAGGMYIYQFTAPLGLEQLDFNGSPIGLDPFGSQTIDISVPSPQFNQGGYAWIPGLAPGANAALQAAKAATRQVKATPPQLLRDVPGEAPEIELEDPFAKWLIRLMTEWLSGGGLGPLPPAGVPVPVLSPCLLPNMRYTLPSCGGSVSGGISY